jgi:hypothetical protein
MRIKKKRLKEMLALRILVVFGLVLAGCSSLAKEIPFEAVCEYPLSDCESEPMLAVVSDQADLESLSGLMAQGLDVDKALNETDFPNEFLLVAFQGLQMSGGHSIEVLGIQQSGERIEVRAEFTSPQGGATLGVTSPYHLVRVKKEDLGPGRFTFVLVDDSSGEEMAKVAHDLR